MVFENSKEEKCLRWENKFGDGRQECEMSLHTAA